MKKISSSITFLHKKVFPALWFGALGVFILISFISILKNRRLEIMGLAVPLIMAAFGYFLFKNLVLDLADEAWDAGDSIVIKNNNTETRIPLKNILNVSYSVVTSPQKVTLSLREACALGKEVSFSPPVSWPPFKKNTLVLNLIERIDEARRS